jgi:hypothetical protein
VVTSTPGVRKFSGWPGVLESHWRKDLMSSSCTQQQQQQKNRAEVNAKMVMPAAEERALPSRFEAILTIL